MMTRDPADIFARAVTVLACAYLCVRICMGALPA